MSKSARKRNVRKRFDTDSKTQRSKLLRSARTENSTVFPETTLFPDKCRSIDVRGVTDTPTRYDDTRSNGKIFTAFYRLSYTTSRRVPVACVDYYSFESPVDYIVPNILIGRRAPDFECATTAAVHDGTTPRPAVRHVHDVRLNVRND